MLLVSSSLYEKYIYFILVRNYVRENLGDRLSILQSLYRSILWRYFLWHE